MALHFSKRIIQFCYTFPNESNISLHRTNKNSIANRRNSKKITTFAFIKRSVTSMRKFPIIQHLASDSGHSTKGLKRGGTTRICKAMKYNDLHLSPHSVYLSKRRLYRLKWRVTDNQWCKYAKQNFICYAHQGIAHAVFYLGDKLYSVKEKILKHNQPDISLVSA
mgnify:CR=1 FL=1